LKALYNIIKKRPAFGTQAICLPMLSITENINHPLDSSDFFFHS
jgi:hypothetical protein